MAEEKLIPGLVSFPGNQDMLEEIMLRVGSSLSMIRCSAVSPTWRELTRLPAFRARFAERVQPAYIGFLIEMQEGNNRKTRLLYAEEGDVSAQALRPCIDATLLASDTVVSSRDGIILTHQHSVGFLTTNLTDRRRLYLPVATNIPKIPRNPAQHTVNTYGQYGVVPDAGNSGMAFFVKDAAKVFLPTYDGVSFCSGANIFIHVCVFKDGIGWERHVSHPIESAEAALFHRNPYCVLQGKNKLYMMYIVGYIVCFDLDTRIFSQIALPGDLSVRVKSWYDYTVAPHTDGGLVLVNYTFGNLDTWVLRQSNNTDPWTLESKLSLVDLFGNRFQSLVWKAMFSREAFSIGSDNFFAIQVRTAFRDARFVFLTTGFDGAMFEIDMKSKCVRDLINYERTGLIGRIYELSEEWPPKV